MWAYHERFLEIVRESWKEDVEGSPMFRLTTKLKRLKLSLQRIE